MKLLQKIFSIKNENNHKVLRLLGLKIKFKSTKKILLNKLNKLIQDCQNNSLMGELKCLSLERSHLQVCKQLKFYMSKKKPTVVMLIYHRAHWAMDSIYNEMLKEDFDVSIMVLPAMEMEESLREQEFNENCLFFEQLGYNVKKGYDFQKCEIYDLNTNLPDIIIYQTHWMWDYPPEYDVKNFYNRALCISIPYGFFLANIQQAQFNQDFHNLVWLNCAETYISKKMAEIYAKNRGENVLVTGYSKMDNLYLNSNDYRWKNSENKKIIWAPHYSINTDYEINYANFHRYYKNLYDYTSQSKKIDMLLKPHPMLKSRCIQTKTLTDEA